MFFIRKQLFEHKVRVDVDIDIEWSVDAYEGTEY